MDLSFTTLRHAAKQQPWARRAVRRARRTLRPPWWGVSWRTMPRSLAYGADRGIPVNRYYIASFLAEHVGDVHGHVLEVQDSTYTNYYGADRVTARDVVDIDANNSQATILTDLAAADMIPSDTFDCFICTQTMTMLSDPYAFARHVYRFLKPGGVMLLTVSSAARSEPKFLQSDYWRFTPAGARWVFGQVFGSEHISVRGYGNVLAVCASLQGLALEDVSQRRLDRYDPCYTLIVAVRAQKPA